MFYDFFVTKCWRNKKYIVLLQITYNTLYCLSNNHSR